MKFDYAVYDIYNNVIAVCVDSEDAEEFASYKLDIVDAQAEVAYTIKSGKVLLDTDNSTLFTGSIEYDDNTIMIFEDIADAFNFMQWKTMKGMDTSSYKVCPRSERIEYEVLETDAS